MSDPQPSNHTVRESEQRGQLRLLFDLLRSRRAVERTFIASMQSVGLTLAQMEVLFTLHDRGPMRQHQLARTLVVTTGNVVQVVDKLAERALVERQEVADDRRANNLVITSKGDETLNGLVSQLDGAAQQLLREASHDQCQLAAGVVKRIIEAVEEA